MSSDRIETKFDLEMKDRGPQSTAAFTGGSLRDWFAGQALLGIHAAGATSNNEEGWEWAAHAAYAQADAMLKAREAKQ